MISKVVFNHDQLQKLVDFPHLLPRVVSNLRSIAGCTVTMALAFAEHQLQLLFPDVVDGVHIDVNTGELVIPSHKQPILNVPEPTVEGVAPSATSEQSSDKGSDKASKPVKGGSFPIVVPENIDSLLH